MSRAAAHIAFALDSKGTGVIVMRISMRATAALSLPRVWSKLTRRYRAVRPPPTPSRVTDDADVESPTRTTMVVAQRRMEAGRGLVYRGRRSASQ